MVSQYSLKIITIMSILGLWLRAKADFFTAISHMEPLLNTHKKIVDNLENYILNEEKRVTVLKRHLLRYKTEHVLATKGTTEYLENPITAFTLIKRLTTDLDVLQKIIWVSSLDNDKNVIAKIPGAIYPDSEDLMGAIEGLLRLQQTYRLDIGELADGRLIERNSRRSKDPVISTPMTASDCFELGQTSYADEDYQKALLWLMESLRKITSGDDLFNITVIDPLEFISVTHFQLGDIKSAIEWTKKLLAFHPEHPEANANVKIFQEMADDTELEIKLRDEARREKLKEKGEDNSDEGGEQSQEMDLLTKEMMEMYEALCRGDIDIPMEIQRRLKCSYLTKNHPFLKLAPIKMEQIYIEPDVFLFHGVISDEEIERIKNISNPKMIRAGVLDMDTGATVIVHYRVSKATWLRGYESQVVERIAQRTADFTGFSMNTAEDLQVANYGIGGHYEPHLDFEEERTLFAPGDDERIATVLFYMSDVKQGGATVFTELGLTVYPIKNSALFWLNLLPSGEGDAATRHAACPVLRGTKWASNKWIHNIGQELIKPCVRKF